jgi:hypothetical protein
MRLREIGASIRVDAEIFFSMHSAPLSLVDVW